jgi:tRNA dimethylallyltransferase
MSGSGLAAPRIVCILGPTGIGKTALAMDLATRWGAEIVGADSMQVYRQMDIGTSKPTLEERNRVPHHLIDVADPDQPFTVSRYRELAGEAIMELHRARKRIFVVGGTGLYIRALLGGLIEGPGADEDFRRGLKEEINKGGKAHLYEILKEKDPHAATVIHPNDLVRVIRALEVLELTGRSIMDFQQRHRFADASWNALRIGLRMERAVLNERINRRTDAMMAAGFLDEVRLLLAKGYGESLKPMQALGYRHLTAVINGRNGLAEAVELLKRDTRLYAKRQMTWLAADKSIDWFSPDDIEGISGLIVRFFAEEEL